jgi:hypothetical protein
MELMTAIYGLGACLVGQSIIAGVAVYQWHKWEKRAAAEAGGVDALQDRYNNSLENWAKANACAEMQLRDALFTQRALLFAWTEAAKKARQKSSHFVAARTLIDEALFDD